VLIAEADALRQWKVAGVVDGVGLAAHVELPGIAAAFAAAAGVFLAAEGAADFGPAGSDIDIGDAAVAASGGDEQLGLANIVGEDRGAEALGYAIMQGDGLVERAVGNDVKDRGERFFLDDLELVTGAGDTWRGKAAAGELVAG